MKKEIKICLNCHYLGDIGDKNCPYCGIELRSKCPECGGIIKTPFARYCAICGIDLKKIVEKERNAIG